MYFTEVNEDDDVDEYQFNKEDYNDYFTFNKFLWEQSAWEFFHMKYFFLKENKPWEVCGTRITKHIIDNKGSNLFILVLS
jgi:hypothetical protein